KRVARESCRRRTAYCHRGRAACTLLTDVELSALGQRGHPSAGRSDLRPYRLQAPNYLHAGRVVGDQIMNDPIVDEVRSVRDAHAARFNYDLDAIFLDIKEQEKRSGRIFVSLVPEQREPIEPAESDGGLPSITDSRQPSHS